MASKVTIADIAAHTGVSSTTVSFVLNGREKGISDETKQRVLDAAFELGYDRVSRRSREGWTRVAYLTPNISHFNSYTSFFAGVYAQLQQRAMEHQLELFLMEFHPEADSAEQQRQLQDIRKFGIDVFISNSTGIEERLQQLQLKSVLIQAGTPVENTLYVHCDDYTAGRLSAEYAWDMGHREVGMVFPDSCLTSPRFNGFHDRFLELGGRWSEEFCWHTDGPLEAFEAMVADRSAKGCIPTFFYCFADNYAFPTIRGFYRSGLKVPDDVSVMGTDNLFWGQWTQPALTTIDLREDLFAEKVIEAIEVRKNDGAPYQLAVPVRLLERESVRQL